jgi:ankyrin repeat protein
MRTLEKKLIKEAASGHTQNVKKLLDKGVNINAVGKYGYTALIAASWASYSETVEYLLSKGADPNIASADNATALFAAVARNSLPCVKSLVEYGANPDICRETEFQNENDSLGSSPIHIAIYNKSYEIAILLIDGGAHLNHIHYGRTPIQAARHNGFDKLTRYLEILKTKKS